MNQELAQQQTQVIEQVLVSGDLSKLTTEQRVNYYNRVCASLGLNPMTKPFAYILLNNKLTLYALKDCTEQLRSLRGVSLRIKSRELIGDVYVVTAQAEIGNGRCDEATGAVPVKGAQGDALANLYMKAETKAKRRVTLSICGLGMLDESEADSIPAAKPFADAEPLPTAKPAQPEQEAVAGNDNPPLQASPTPEGVAGMNDQQKLDDLDGACKMCPTGDAVENLWNRTREEWKKSGPIPTKLLADAYALKNSHKNRLKK